MLKKFLLGCFAALALSACAQNPKVTAVSTPAGDNIGATVTPEGAITYSDLVPRMASTDSLAVKITGKVSEVCLKKGCWMTIEPEQTDQAPMRVTFKDYAFFMPKDIVGKKVVLDGFAYIETTPVDVLRHYAEDAGKTKEEIAAITEPKRELSYEAAGVLILK